MKTASFFTYQGPGRISIARWAPKDMLPGLAVYRPLNPTATMLKLPREQYEPLYQDILSRLNPHQVVGDLRRLAEGNEPMLLCWEMPPFTETHWCHRRLVARWLEDALGLVVPECYPPPGTQLSFGLPTCSH